MPCRTMMLTNHALLHAFCQESGGNYFNLKIASDDHVLTGVGDVPFNLVAIECNPDEIAEVYPKVGTAITPADALWQVACPAGEVDPSLRLRHHRGFQRNIHHQRPRAQPRNAPPALWRTRRRRNCRFARKRMPTKSH